MRIARVILQLGRTQTELLESAARIAKETPSFSTNGEKHQRGARRWDAFRKSIFEDDYLPCGDSYRLRIRALLASAVAANADLVLLPACALQSSDDELDYVDGAAPAHVVAGTLWLPGRRGVIPEDAHEGGIVYSRGEVITAFRGSIRTTIEGRPAVLAISSAIKDVNRIFGLAPDGADHRRTRIVLDMGHHQYGVRYLLHTMRIAHDTVGETGAAKAFVALSYWRFFGGSGTADWVQPRNGSTWKLGRKNDSVAWTDSAGRTRTDVVDYFDV